MQNFELASSMLTMRGVFYPTGYVFAMFPDLEDAEQVIQALPSDKHSKPPMLLPASTVLDTIAPTDHHSAHPWPSVGTEAATVKIFAELASQGHCALMVYAHGEQQVEAVMAAVRTRPFSCARRYGALVIEDLL